jgi:hypothetical protein
LDKNSSRPETPTKASAKRSCFAISRIDLVSQFDRLVWISRKPPRSTNGIAAVKTAIEYEYEYEYEYRSTEYE